MKIPPLVWPQSAEPYDEDLLLDIEAGTVAYLVRGRNAWHSTWVRHWFRHTHLFSDVASARAGAERLRQRGNVFYVRESPALILRGPHNAVVLCEIGVDVPFDRFTGFDTTPVDTDTGRWIDGMYPGVSLRDAVAAFSEASGHWDSNQTNDDRILMGIVDRDFMFAPRKGRLQALESYAQGSDYPLGWRPQRNIGGFSSSGVAAVARRWQEMVQLATVGKGEQSLNSSLIEYREVVLDVEPLSQWNARKLALDLAKNIELLNLATAWREARDRCDRLEEAIQQAEAGLKTAQDARFPPANTSAGMRAQRERVEHADHALVQLRLELETVQAAELLRRLEYWNAADSSS